MRRPVYIIVILIGLSLLTQCITQKNITKMKIFNKELVFPDMSSDYERLTPSEMKDFKKKKDLAIPEYSERNIYRYTDYNKEGRIQYSFNDENNTIGVLKYIKIEPDENNKDFEKSICFLEYKRFSGNKLVEKDLKLISGSSFLMSLKKYKYDEGGNIINEYDYSKNFKQSLPDILKILEKYNLSMEFNNAIVTGGNRSYLTTIEAVNSNYGEIWLIGIGLYNGIIDDATGEIIVHNSDTFLREKQGKFQFIEEDTFKRKYGEKSIKELEQETDSLIFVYQHSSKIAFP
ncbi:MAG TPA: hypothetical protein VL022_09640 [Moheibacter sp.]|nr:hypothetical protein [Moheibacter sp.]